MKTMVAKPTKHRSRRFRRFIRANEAVSALEYAVLVGVVVVGIGAALGTFTNQIKDGPPSCGRQDRKHKWAQLVRRRTQAGDETAATSKRRGHCMTIKEIVRRLRRFPSSDKAVSALEYAVLVGVVVVGISAALGAFQNQIKTALANTGTTFTNLF